MTAIKVILAAAAIALVVPSTAAASCVMAPPMRSALEDAPVVIVGTVTEVRYEDRWATVSVGEVWKGDGIPSTVEVRSGAGRPNVMSSVDRIYKVGGTYLFVPYERNGDVLRDNLCTSTMRFTSRAARFRPETVAAHVTPEAARPTAEPSSTAGSSSPDPTPDPTLAPPSDSARASSAWPWLVVGGAALVLTVGTAFLLRRGAERGR